MGADRGARHGAGIPPEDLAHIWERFYGGQQAGESHPGRTEETGSAGLGLALVKELTEAMDGTIAVETIVDQRPCFTVTLRCFGTGL